MEIKPMGGKQAVFFDVNQTLIWQGLSFEASFHEVWNNFAGRWSTDHPGRELWQSYITRWHQRKKARGTFRQLDELQQQCLTEAFGEYHIPISEAMTRAFIREVQQLQLEAKSMPPLTLETLASLEPHYRLAIISNSPRSEVLLLVERFGLQSFFPQERIFTAQKPADKKPAPALFKAALNSFKLSPRHAVMVGNSWKHDVCGAVKAGIDAIWLHETDREHSNEAKKISQHRLGKRKVYLIKQIEQLQELLPKRNI